MNELVTNFHAMNGRMRLSQKVVMISRRIENLSATIHHPQNVFNQLIVHRWPVPVAFESPSIQEISDKIQLFRLVLLQEFQAAFRLRKPEPKMLVTDKK